MNGPWKGPPVNEKLRQAATAGTVMVATKLRLTLANSRGIKLVGYLFPAQSSSMIILAHGFTSDKYSRGRFETLASALAAAGFASFAFDFSGCGESEDDTITVEKETADLSSVIGFLKDEGYDSIGLFGHSLGGLVCLKSYAPDIEAMVLTGPVTGPADYNWKAYFSPAQLQELEERGRARYAVESLWRRNIVVDRKLLDEFLEIDQERLLGSVKCPVLIIHGNNPYDAEELSLLTASRQGMRYLPAGSHLEVIQGARHDFLDNMDDVSDLAADWFQAHMTGS